MSDEDTRRIYETTHPWISFSLDANKIAVTTWLLLGEAASKMDHIAGVPLKPAVAQTLHTLYITRGVQGTTAIEGNTLTEDQVRQAVEGELELPPSQEYLKQEVVNVLDACTQILDKVQNEGVQPIGSNWILGLNKMVLRDLELKEDVVPGETRTHSVGVARYRGAPAEDCDYLLDKLCNWLNNPIWTEHPDFKKSFAIIRAILAHLYIAWIHPFGDGNGRTARLLEFQLLVEGGAPTPAAHLLSNHFNMTRDAYYRELDKTSRGGPPYPVESFIAYALQGFVDGLREQLKVIREQQSIITWTNLVHEEIPGHTSTEVRRRNLLFDLPVDKWTKRSEVQRISTAVAISYIDKTDKTVSRDLNALHSLGLIQRSKKGVRPNVELIKAFLPMRLRDGTDASDS